MDINTSGLTDIQRGRVNKSLNRVFRFSEGVMTLGEYLSRHTWEYKKTHTRYHAARKTHLCYEKLARPKTEYTVWRQAGLDCDGDPRYTGMDVPKIVWDLLDLPARHSEGY